MKLTKIKFGRDGFLLHVSSALLGLFVFYSVVFAANLLKIPFYLGYKKYIIDITVLSVEADRILWAASITLFSAINVHQVFLRFQQLLLRLLSLRPCS